jgi:ribonuclease P protein component
LAVLRLKTRPQFQAVLKGVTLSRTAHFALHRCALGAPEAPAMSAPPLFPTCAVWLGAMVPKRWAKRAVTRNCIKRQIYNVSAEFESALKPGAHLVRLRSGFDRSQFISASSDLLRGAVRAELLVLFARAQSDGRFSEDGVAACP